MQTRYLLPCSCGQKIVIEPRQAGRSISCPCGNSLEAPTMLKMTALEPAEPETASRRPSAPWGIRQSLALLGAVITLCALFSGIYLVQTRPVPPELSMAPEAIHQETQGLTPVQAWRFWQAVRRSGLDHRRPAASDAYDEAHVRWSLKMAVVLIIAVGGVSLTIAPLATGRIGVARQVDTTV